MIVDDLIELLPVDHAMDLYISKKFVITRNLTRAILRHTNLEDVDRTSNLLRLPYSSVWFDFDTGKELYGVWVMAPVNAQVGSFKIFRRGADELLVSEGAVAFNFTSEELWPLNNEYETPDELVTKTRFWFRGVPEVEQELHETCTRLLIGVLLFINDRQHVVIKSQDVSRLNKKRRRLGKAPVDTYNVVDLSQRIKKNLEKIASEEAESRRLHSVRGHFKLINNKLHWWQPHLRGNALLGKVHKHYKGDKA
jgi:hypothetical protein